MPGAKRARESAARKVYSEGARKALGRQPALHSGVRRGQRSLQREALVGKLRDRRVGEAVRALGVTRVVERAQLVDVVAVVVAERLELVARLLGKRELVGGRADVLPERSGGEGRKMRGRRDMREMRGEGR